MHESKCRNVRRCFLPIMSERPIEDVLKSLRHAVVRKCEIRRRRKVILEEMGGDTGAQRCDRRKSVTKIKEPTLDDVKLKKRSYLP